MYSRVTLVEIDTMRTSMEDALALYVEHVLPQLRELEGYGGVFVLTTPEGKGMIVTFWETAEAADRAVPFAVEQLERYVTLFSAPPGREHYEVVYADLPVIA